MRDAVRLHRSAEACLSRLGKSGKATRLVLSLFFKAVLGIPRIFHFESLDDIGFAILTGGKRVLGRNTLGGLVRAAPVRGVLAFVKRTEPTLRRLASHLVSIDEHAVPRFTRKFNIRKGFHTIRNKRMKIEKLFFSFDVGARRLLTLLVTRGDGRLARIGHKLLGRLEPRVRGAEVRVIVDAGAAENHADLLDLVCRKGQVTLVRVPRRPAYRKRWAALPKTSWTDLDEPGPYERAAPKRISVAETRMTIAGRSARSESVRTIVIREHRRKGKDRWHALWIFGDESTPAYELVTEFRRRQHHEQTYRVLLHDLFVDTAPSGYNKKSPNPRRPGFRQNAITLFAWIAALAANVLDHVATHLPERLPPYKHARAHPRTLRRWLFLIPADVFQADDTLIVFLKPRRLHSLWNALVDRANRAPVRVPWMGNRRLILALRTPLSLEGALDPAAALRGVWC
jgi:hypothetical protein